MSSFRKINYSLRPAKHAQRRMIGELIYCLSSFRPVRNYQYVGFGSLWFEEFRLFHRLHGFTKMISIEKSGNQKRFIANKPYKAVDILFGNSNTELNKIDWEIPSIVWLDYDSQITSSALMDVDTVVARCVSGSMLCLTFNAMEAAEFNEAKELNEGDAKALEMFKSRFEEHLSGKVFLDDLKGNPFRDVNFQICKNKIEKALSIRNLGKAEKDISIFECIARFDYTDGAPMVTFVFLLYAHNDCDKFQQCEFQAVDFLPSLGATVKIEMPVMTMKEIRGIEAQLPENNIEQIDRMEVPTADIKKFMAIYRYLPNFAVLET